MCRPSVVAWGQGKNFAGISGKGVQGRLDPSFEDTQELKASLLAFLGLIRYLCGLLLNELWPPPSLPALFLSVFVQACLAWLPQWESRVIRGLPTCWAGNTRQYSLPCPLLFPDLHKANPCAAAVSSVCCCHSILPASFE